MAGAWELKEQNKVACCILNTEHVSFAWALNFRNLRIPGPEPYGVTGMPFDHARNRGVQIMLEKGCEWLFFLDSDVCPPPNAVERLLAHGKPLISGMYCRRSPPWSVPVMMRDHQWVTTIPQPGEDPVVEVEHVGAGCLLIHRTVLERLPPHRPGKPWFDWRVDLAGQCKRGEGVSEDYAFCNQVRKHLNIPVLVDTSIRCRHVGLAEADFGTFTPLGVVPMPQGK